ncbi:unnamed protein product [Candida verbasci]|uniref:Uncharacterized protein n=1 Tax=Candida verbasci TaxID=1227364 RepID=A0A9W4XJI8_9ASCO|nr:unnamed protein product [Candida verbasci]
MNLDERLRKCQQEKQNIKENYCQISDQLNDDNLECSFEILMNLDEMTYNYRVIKCYLESLSSGFSKENNSFIFKIETRIEALYKQIVTDTGLHLHCNGLKSIRTQLFENAAKVGRLIYEIETSNEIEEKDRFVTPNRMKSISESLPNPKNISNQGYSKWTDLPWGKDKVNIIKEAVRLFSEKRQRGEYISEKFQENYNSKMTLPTAYYLLYHYKYGEKDYRKANETLENFDSAYTEAISKIVEDKNTFINQKLKSAGTPLASPTDLVAGIQLRDLFMKQYGTIEEPITNVKSY